LAFTQKPIREESYRLFNRIDTSRQRNGVQCRSHEVKKQKGGQEKIFSGVNTSDVGRHSDETGKGSRQIRFTGNRSGRQCEGVNLRLPSAKSLSNPPNRSRTNAGRGSKNRVSSLKYLGMQRMGGVTWTTTSPSKNNTRKRESEGDRGCGSTKCKPFKRRRHHRTEKRQQSTPDAKKRIKKLKLIKE